MIACDQKWALPGAYAGIFDVSGRSEAPTGSSICSLPGASDLLINQGLTTEPSVRLLYPHREVYSASQKAFHRLEVLLKPAAAQCAYSVSYLQPRERSAIFCGRSAT